jgi:hypothetical protein
MNRNIILDIDFVTQTLAKHSPVIERLNGKGAIEEIN